MFTHKKSASFVCNNIQSNGNSHGLLKTIATNLTHLLTVFVVGFQRVIIKNNYVDYHHVRYYRYLVQLLRLFLFFFFLVFFVSIFSLLGLGVTTGQSIQEEIVCY